MIQNANDNFLMQYLFCTLGYQLKTVKIIFFMKLSSENKQTTFVRYGVITGSYFQNSVLTLKRDHLFIVF